MRQQQHCRWQHTLQTSSSCRSDVKLLRRGSCFTTFLHLFLMDASKQVFLRDTMIVSMALKETGRMSAGRPSLSHCQPSMTVRRDSGFRRQSWILLYYPSAEVVHTFGVLYIAYQQPWKLLQALRRHLSCVMNHHRKTEAAHVFIASRRGITLEGVRNPEQGAGTTCWVRVPLPPACHS